MEYILIVAAKSGASGAEVLIGLIFLLIVIIISLVAGANNQKWVVVRNGLPYCPNCNRQVSLKAARPCCRACGYDLTKPPSREPPPSLKQAHEAAQHASLLVEEAARMERARKQEEREALAELAKIQQEEEQQERKRERTAKFKAQRAENGVYTDYQLFGYGIAIIAVPAAIIGLLALLSMR